MPIAHGPQTLPLSPMIARFIMYNICYFSFMENIPPSCIITSETFLYTFNCGGNKESDITVTPKRYYASRLCLEAERPLSLASAENATIETSFGASVHTHVRSLRQNRKGLLRRKSYTCHPQSRSQFWNHLVIWKRQGRGLCGLRMHRPCYK